MPRRILASPLVAYPIPTMHAPCSSTSAHVSASAPCPATASGSSPSPSYLIPALSCAPRFVHSTPAPTYHCRALTLVSCLRAYWPRQNPIASPSPPLFPAALLCYPTSPWDHAPPSLLSDTFHPTPWLFKQAQAFLSSPEPSSPSPRVSAPTKVLELLAAAAPPPSRRRSSEPLIAPALSPCILSAKEVFPTPHAPSLPPRASTPVPPPPPSWCLSGAAAATHGVPVLMGSHFAGFPATPPPTSPVPLPLSLASSVRWAALYVHDTWSSHGILPLLSLSFTLVSLPSGPNVSIPQCHCCNLS